MDTPDGHPIEQVFAKWTEIGSVAEAPRRD
jgi:hypothetical protein